MARNVLGKALETLKTFKINYWIFGLSNIFLFYKKSYYLIAFIFLCILYLFLFSSKRETFFIGRKYIRAVTM